MPVIKVWCMPKRSEDWLKELWAEIVRTVEGVSELKLRGKNSMTILFPTDAMEYGLGEEIIIEVTGLFKTPERTEEVRQELARRLATTVSSYFPSAMVECFVYPFDPAQGFFKIQRIGGGD